MSANLAANINIPFRELNTVIFNKTVIDEKNNTNRFVLVLQESIVEESISLLYEHFFPTTDTSKSGCLIRISVEDEETILKHLLQRKKLREFNKRRISNV